MLENKGLLNRVLRALAIIMLSFSCMGMGALNDEETVKIPEPDYNFSVTLVDQLDVSSDIVFFSLDGQTYISGKRGGATVSIPFANIRSIDFRLEGEDLFAILNLKEKSEFELNINKDQLFYGQLPFGTFSIKTEDTKKVIFKNPTKQE